jgi:predicted MFS family arabinose efflux permease
LPILLGCIVAGFGYGMAQPYVYDVTTALASPKKATYALALVMTMNYVAIVIAPFVVESVQKLLGENGNSFPFILNAVISFAAMLFLFIRNMAVVKNRAK